MPNLKNTGVFKNMACMYEMSSKIFQILIITVTLQYILKTANLNDVSFLNNPQMQPQNSKLIDLNCQDMR